ERRIADGFVPEIGDRLQVAGLHGIAVPQTHLIQPPEFTFVAHDSGSTKNRASIIIRAPRRCARKRCAASAGLGTLAHGPRPTTARAGGGGDLPLQSRRNGAVGWGGDRRGRAGPGHRADRADRRDPLWKIRRTASPWPAPRLPARGWTRRRPDGPAPD